MPPLILLRYKIKGLTDYEINQFNRDPDDKSQCYGVKTQFIFSQKN